MSSPTDFRLCAQAMLLGHSHTRQEGAQTYAENQPFRDFFENVSNCNRSSPQTFPALAIGYVV